ncbi:MAG: DUF2267 domain-containing protein [Actinomycetota bacterium]|jgi:uncharacterized protein (DUF2267 family)|nr:DUF2267 domain-containing protein [Actinomycetota bacterium]
MRDEEFISEVQARAGLSTRGDADRAIRATLALLGDQLPDSVAGPVAAALPEGLGAQLWAGKARSRATGAQAGRLSRGVARGEGSWPGDNTIADADIDSHPQEQKRTAPAGAE